MCTGLSGVLYHDSGHHSKLLRDFKIVNTAYSKMVSGEGVPKRPFVGKHNVVFVKKRDGNLKYYYCFPFIQCFLCKGNVVETWSILSVSQHDKFPLGFLSG